MVKTAINAYTLRALDDGLSGLIDRISAAGYEGIQFAEPYTLDGENAATVSTQLAAVDLPPGRYPI